jgi:hypothetical protein
MPFAGDAILIPSGPQGNHLFVVLNDPMPLPGYGAANHVVMASISTVRAHIPHDTTCILAVGAHPFVVNPSFVYYKDIRIESDQHVNNCIAAGTFTLRPPPFSAVLVNQIKAGFGTSPTIRRVFKSLPI